MDEIKKLTDLGRDRINDIANRIRVFILGSVGEFSWADVAEYIRKEFKGEEREIALIILGYHIGVEEHSKEFLKGWKEFSSNIKGEFEK